MADVITRFKLETTQYDSKLRDAAKSLSAYSKQAELAGKDFDKFTKSGIEAAKAFGAVESGAKNTKDRLKDLVGAYNDVARAYNNLTEQQRQSDFGKAMAQSLSQLQDRIKETKDELYSLGDTVKNSSGLFGEGGLTGMLQVAGGNLLSKGISMLAGDLTDTIQKSIELARQGEGVRLAFERLNQPGLLDNLKQATHGTVSEIELMKQAIKFENFKLPLEDLATYLQFAQQKAKDTGESIDFLVTSIVNGLGRQSKQILDNLGISASELTKRMADGKDMTQAVAEIIREEMAKAGDYVETAADRAAVAAASATDKLEEMGRTAMPVAEAVTEMWNTIRNGGITVLNTVLTPIANSLKYINDLLSNENGIELFEKRLGNTPGMEVGPNVDDNGNYIRRPSHGTLGWNWNTGHYDDEVSSIQEIVVSGTNRKGGGRRTGGGSSGGKKTPSVQDYLNTMYGNMDSLGSSLKGNPDKYFQPVWKMIGEAGRKQIAETIDKQWDYGKDISKTGNNTPKDIKKMSEGMTKYIDTSNKMLGGISSIASGINSMGIELPKEIQGVLGGIQGVMSILSGIATIVAVIEALTTIQTTESTIKSIPVVGWALAGGGIVHAASGYSVPGNHYSGDMVPAMLNSGELVLNKAQQGVLASQLQGGGLQNLKLDGVVTGENIHIVHNRYLKRSGQGELVTW